MKKQTSIVNATLILFVGTLFSKLLGFFREIVVAYQYGTSSISDAFLLTNSIPTLIFGSVATVVSISYIPFCQSIDGKEEKDYFTSNLLNSLIVILFTGCIIFCLFPGVVLRIIAGGLNADARQYAIVMLRIVIFSIIPIIVAQLFQAYSQVNSQFHSTAWYGVVTNIVIIIFTLISQEKTFFLLSLGVLIANTVGMIIALFSIKGVGFKYSAVFKPFDKDVRNIVILTLPLLIESLAYNLSLIVDRSLASYLDSGTISGLSYAGTIGNIASSLVASSIITAIYPRISHMASKERESLDPHLIQYSKVIAFFLCPISIVLIFFSRDIITLIFSHGVLKDASLDVVRESMVCYAIGIVPAGLQTYLIRCYYSLKDTKTPVCIQVFALCSNIALNLLSVRYLRHIGIALSTSVSYLIALVLLGIFLKPKHNLLCSITIAKHAFAGLINALLAGLASFGIMYLIRIDFLIVRVIIEMFVFGVFYLGLAFLMQADAMKMGLQLLKQKTIVGRKD